MKGVGYREGSRGAGSKGAGDRWVRSSRAGSRKEGVGGLGVGSREREGKGSEYGLRMEGGEKGVGSTQLILYFIILNKYELFLNYFPVNKFLIDFRRTFLDFKVRHF